MRADFYGQHAMLLEQLNTLKRWLAVNNDQLSADAKRYFMAYLLSMAVHTGRIGVIDYLITGGDIQPVLPRRGNGT